MLLNFIVSLLIGMLPDVLFLTFFISKFKGKTDKKLKLFIFLMIGYVLLIMICRYQLMFYIAYIIYSFVVVKKLYKAHIIDLFVISIGYAFMTLLSFACAKLIPNYWAALVINRITEFTPLLLGNNLNKLYMKYKGLWNINKNSKVKSITIRNISLVIVNAFILIMNTFSVLVMIDFLKTQG